MALSSSLGASLNVSSSSSEVWGLASKSRVEAEMAVPIAPRQISKIMAVAAPPRQGVETKQSGSSKLAESVRVGVLGASGYTGSEIVRLLATHPILNVALMTADRKAGQSLSSVFPHLASQSHLPNMVAVKDADFEKVDAIFCCLPHGTTQEIVASLPKHLKVVDLSADFRLKDANVYKEWYNGDHRAPHLLEEAVYGLSELQREKIRRSRLVANPGCYPTCSQLPLVPLLKAGKIEEANIIIDAKSGVSGAGRSAKEANLYTEIDGGMKSYGLTRHRHVPEIEQELSAAVGSKVKVSFTPHLIPMPRGMQTTIYVQMKNGTTVDDLRNHLSNTYESEEFVDVLERDVIPVTSHVRGSNYCRIGVFEDRLPGRAIIVSVIDNLVKGASGQALQNMNLMLGLAENLGLLQQPMFP